LNRPGQYWDNEKDFKSFLSRKIARLRGGQLHFAAIFSHFIAWRVRRSEPLAKLGSSFGSAFHWR
jgi:hypothetical protein